MTGARRLRGDAGQIAGIEAVPFGLLVMVVGILVTAHTWAVVNAKFVTAAAAREATRGYVEARSFDAGAAEAERAAQEVARRAGAGPAALTLRRTSPGFGRCVPSRFQAGIRVPAIAVPWRPDRIEVVVRADHAEVVDPYRAGLPGVADCVVGP
jgi:hypothetical protein